MRAKGPGESALVLLDVVDLLVEQGIEYAVIGAIAASIHGVVRASMDADVLLAMPARKAPDLERGLAEAGLQTELTRGDSIWPMPRVRSWRQASR